MKAKLLVLVIILLVLATIASALGLSAYAWVMFLRTGDPLWWFAVAGVTIGALYLLVRFFDSYDRYVERKEREKEHAETLSDWLKTFQNIERNKGPRA